MSAQRTGVTDSSVDQMDAVFLENGDQAELPGFNPNFAQWIAQLRNHHKSKSTLTTYAAALRPCLATLQSISETDVTAQTISVLKVEIFEQMQQRMLDEGVSARTVSLRMAALRSFGLFLHKNGHVRCDGLLMSRCRRFKKPTLHAPQAEDCANLLNINHGRDTTWQSVRDQAILRLISTHGLTITEALAIDCEHLHLGQGRLTVTGRLKKRTLRLETQVIEDLAAYINVSPYEIEDGSPLFRGSPGGRLTPRAVQLSTAALRDQLGLHEDTTPRTLRKSRILQLRSNGVSDFEIMEQVGITSISEMICILSEVPTDHLAIEDASSRVRATFINGVEYTPVEQKPAIDTTRRQEVVSSALSVRRPTRNMKSLNSVADDDIRAYIEHVFSTRPLNTASIYSSSVRAYERFLGRRQNNVRTATVEDIIAFRNRPEIQIGFSVRHYFALCDLYRFLHKVEAIVKNPMLDLDRPKRKSTKKRPQARPEDVRCWLTAITERIAQCPSDFNMIRLGTMVCLLAFQGLKCHQILRLRQSHFCGPTVTIDDYTSTLAPLTRELLLRLLEMNNSESDLIFQGRPSNQLLTRQCLWLWIKNAARDFKLPKLTLEQFAQAFRRGLVDALRDGSHVASALGMKRVNHLYDATSIEKERQSLTQNRLQGE